MPPSGKKGDRGAVQGMLWCEFLYRDTADLLQSARLSHVWDGHIIVDATRTGRRLSSRTRVDYYLSALYRPPKDPPGVLFCLGASCHT